MNITLLSHIDCAKSGLSYVKSLKKCSDFNVNYITQGKIPKDIEDVIYNSDILWCKGDTRPLIDNGKFIIMNHAGTRPIEKFGRHTVKKTAKVLHTAGGSFFRRKIRGYLKAYGMVPLEKFIETCDKITTVSPDLNYPELNGEWLPHTYDVEECENSWSWDGGKLIISCYEAQADSKGTKKYLYPALEILRNKGYDIEARRIKGVTNQESINIKKDSTIYFEQISPIGVYGKSGVEAMAYGIPIICSITESSVKQANPYENYGSVCLKAYDTDSLVLLLEDILNKKIDLSKISAETKEYALQYHGYSNVSSQIKRICEELLC